MINIELLEISGIGSAIKGMRNPMNSWDKCDSYYIWPDDEEFHIGPNDRDLMMRLRNAGTDHRKFMRMIVVYANITAPLYWWKEFETYKVGTVANSCSTMHKIADKEFTVDDFSYEHLGYDGRAILDDIIGYLNFYREKYIDKGLESWNELNSKKDIWWQMIQLLPSSYNQKRTVMMNYEVLANIYKSRKDHKLDEWRDFCKWVETLPHSELITGETKNE